MSNRSHVKEQKFVRRSVTCEAIQFTGKNREDVVDFIEKHGGVVMKVYGEKWITFRLKTPDKQIIRTTDFIVWNIPGIHVYSFREFKQFYRINKSHKILVPENEYLD